MSDINEQKNIQDASINNQAKWYDIIFTIKFSAIVTIAATVVLVAAITIFVVNGSWKYSNILDESKVGQFGDFIGGVVGTLLAFVAAILYYVSLKEQRKDVKINQDNLNLQTIALKQQIEEFKLQREELELTRKELSGQKKEFEEQNKTLKQQRFENTFFNMLSLQQEIVNNLVLDYSIGSGPKKQATSRMVFKVFFSVGMIDTYYEGLIQLIKGNNIEAYTKAPDINMFDHYFRHLYRIIKFVDSSDLIDDSMRYEYTCIIRAQLSDYELVMMFYNGLAIKESKLKPLIQRYALLNNLRFDLLADAKHKDLYSEGAYNYKKKTTE